MVDDSKVDVSCEPVDHIQWFEQNRDAVLVELDRYQKWLTDCEVVICMAPTIWMTKTQQKDLSSALKQTDRIYKKVSKLRYQILSGKNHRVWEQFKQIQEDVHNYREWSKNRKAMPSGDSPTNDIVQCAREIWIEDGKPKNQPYGLGATIAKRLNLTRQAVNKTLRKHWAEITCE